MRKPIFLVLAAIAVLGLVAVAHAEETLEQGPSQPQVQQEAQVQLDESKTEATAPVAECSLELPGPAPVEIVGAVVVKVFEMAGQQCGGVVCGPFEYCCNPTCNTCLPYGMECLMIAC